MFYLRFPSKELHVQSVCSGDFELCILLETIRQNTVNNMHNTKLMHLFYILCTQLFWYSLSYVHRQCELCINAVLNTSILTVKRFFYS